jgi:hypothetical protein
VRKVSGDSNGPYDSPIGICLYCSGANTLSRRMQDKVIIVTGNQPSLYS